MTRSQGWLAALLGVQLVLIATIRPWGDVSAPEAVGAPLIPELADGEPVAIDIDGDGTTISLARADGGWSLPELGGYPADEAKVERLVETLASAVAGRAVVSSARHHAPLRLRDDDYERRIRVRLANGDGPPVSLLVGTSPDTRRAHVRRSDDAQVHEVRGLAKYDLPLEPRSWTDRQLYSIPFDSISSLTIENANGTIEIERRGGGWVAVGDERGGAVSLPSAAGNRIVRAAASIWIAAPIGTVDTAAQGFDRPLVSWTLRYGVGDEAAADVSSAEELSVRVGALVEGATPSQRYATTSASEHAVAVTEKQISDLVAASFDALVSGGSQ